LPEAIQSILATIRYACALARSGTLYCWGTNELGALGQLPLSYTDTPIQLR
jgi:hypothetical protein